MTHDEAIQELEKHAEIFKKAFNLAIESLNDLDPKSLTPEQLITLADWAMQGEWKILEIQSKLEP
jgi:hypothetical protein